VRATLTPSNSPNKIFRHLYSKAYIELVKMPEVPGYLYDKLGTRPEERKTPTRAQQTQHTAIRQTAARIPSRSNCLHNFRLLRLSPAGKPKERIASRQAIIVTDFDVHVMAVSYYEQYLWQ
jgi:hypothetical protein